MLPKALSIPEPADRIKCNRLFSGTENSAG
jgi:hypothetical protein